MHTRSSSPRDPTRPRALGSLLLAACALPSVAQAIPPPELAAAVVSDLLILLGAVAGAAFAWFFSVRRRDPDGPARRAWRQLGAVVALSLLITGGLVARHRAIDRERAQAPLFRTVEPLLITDDPGLPPSAVSHEELRRILATPHPPLLIDLRFDPGEEASADLPRLEPLVDARVLGVTPYDLLENPAVLDGEVQPPILICWTGETSARVAVGLRQHDVEARFLAGGSRRCRWRPGPTRGSTTRRTTGCSARRRRPTRCRAGRASWRPERIRRASPGR